MKTCDGSEEDLFGLHFRCGPLKEVSDNVHVFTKVTLQLKLEMDPRVPGRAWAWAGGAAVITSIFN